ncbi:MAG: DUF4476 domain-containing protein [Bacteroidota bacterium]|nr:DUF4476 domain-containing protein [Bacteroidota bacterium]
MKTIFTLLASTLMSLSVFASGAKPKSELSVKSLDKSDIRVVVDGFNFEPGFSSLMIQGLDAGYHAVQVYTEENDARRREEIIYNSSVLVRPKTLLSITIDCSGNASVDETAIRGNSYENDGKCYDVSKDDPGGRLGDYDTHYGYANNMSSLSDRQFSQVLQSISKEWLEANKLKSATHIVNTNNLTSAQVKQLVLLFSFETNKLELAKQAYANTVDKENYFILNDVFSFSGSKLELARYIRNF